jgi:demethylmenaquinone methyltransferase/2-methoxy-6-polyprenyl-1,4-benzoquinol methylase
VIVDGKRPDRWPQWFFKLFVWFSSRFGVTEEYFDGHAWESVERFFQDTTFEEVYGGLMYISSGMAAPPPD